MSRLAVFTIVARVEDDFNLHTDVYALDTRDGYLGDIETAQISAVITTDDAGEVRAEWVL